MYKVNTSLLNVSKDPGGDIYNDALFDGDTACVTRLANVKGIDFAYIASKAEGTNRTPVEGWAARDVVRHLVEWFPSFLQAGAGIELARGPSVDDDPVAAWQVHADAVQANYMREEIYAQTGNNDRRAGIMETRPSPTVRRL